jgi:hypothetical protein
MVVKTAREVKDETESPRLRKMDTLSPPLPPLQKGSFEKIKLRDKKTSLVARGRAKFMPPKPGGKMIAEKHFPDFRRATPTT